MESETLIFHIPDDYIGIRIDVALAEIISDLSRSKLTNWLKEGYILVNHRPAKPKDKVIGGEEIIITPPFAEESQAFNPENIPLNIVFEDEHLIVINKPSGLTVHPGNGNWSGTLLNGLLYHYPELNHIPRAGIVHRLDKDTTGLMVIARSLTAQINLIEQLQARSVSRIYRAFVEGHPFKEGIINKNIGRDPHNRIKMTALEHGGREAVTRYRVLKSFAAVSYVECKLETGRTHQIRVHFKDIGHPLLADPVYGTKKINYAPEIVHAIYSLNRQALHALKLSFIHPLSQEIMSFKARLPEDMRNLLHALTFNEANSTAERMKSSFSTEEFDNEGWDNEDDNNGWEIIYAYDDK